MSRIFSKEELLLLKYSSIIQDYPELQTVMETYPNLQDNELKTLSQEVRRIIADDYSRIVGAAKQEWYLLQDRAKYPCIDPRESLEHTKCELCGNTQCDILFPIANHDQTKILYVGSTCITKFVPRSKAAVLEEQKARKNAIYISRLNQRHPGIYHQFFEQSFAGDDRAYLVVNPLYKAAKDCHTMMRKLCNAHIEAEEDQLPEIDQQIATEAQKYAEYERQIEEHLITAPSDYRIPDRKTVNRLMARNKKETVTQIRRLGGINKISLRDIDEPSFLKRHYLSRVQRLVQDSSIRIVDIGEHNGQTGYIAKAKKTNIEVFIPHYNMAVNFGQEIMENKKTKKDETLLNICYVDEHTDIMGMINAALNRLMRFYQIVPIAFRTDPDELYFRYKGTHCKASAEDAVNQDMPFFCNPDKFSLTYLIKVLEKQEALVDESEWGALFDKKRDDVILFK